MSSAGLINSGPKASDATEALIQQVTVTFYGNGQQPLEGESFGNPETTFTRVKEYDFVIGFAIVESQTETYRWVYCCVHRGKTQNTRKLTADTEVFKIMDGEDECGTTLRQRQGKIGVNFLQSFIFSNKGNLNTSLWLYDCSFIFPATVEI